MDNSQIDLINSSVFKLFYQMLESFVIFRGDHHPGGILIQSVHDARSQDTVNPGEVLTMMKKGIDQCARRVSISGVNNHHRSLIHHNDGRVLIEDGERKGFWVE